MKSASNMTGEPINFAKHESDEELNKLEGGLSQEERERIDEIALDHDCHADTPDGHCDHPSHEEGPEPDEEMTEEDLRDFEGFTPNTY